LFSWTALILQYVEGDNLYKTMDFTVPAYTPTMPEDSSHTGWPPGNNRGPWWSTIPPGLPGAGKPNPNMLAATNMPKLFVCPSAPRAQPANTFKDYAVVYDAGSFLNGNCCPERTTTPAIPFSGMAWLNSAVKIADVTDGTSNTLFLTEKANNADQSWCLRD